jgi:RNA polymerase-binding transcription factor DksA
MATKKKAAKPAAKKPAPKKVVKASKPASKPVKKAAKPAPKPAKPAPKAVAKKVVAKKPAKPAPKPVKKVAPVKKAVKPAPKPVKKVAPVKKAVVSKPVPQAKKPEPIVTKTQPVVKKPEIKQVAVPAKPQTIAKPVAKNPKDIKIAPAPPVKLPKITTKTARKYQPDFTKSVLDQQKNDPGAAIVRYSDSELSEFKEIILRKLEAAKKELHYLQGLITRKDEMGGDESENRYMTMEDGSLSMEREQLSQMASRQITFIDHLEKALMRIENKTYGICRVTGKLIDKARLKAVPHATLSIEAKMGTVK